MMTYKLIHTENYLLAVDDSEIKYNDYYYDSNYKESTTPIYIKSQDPKFYEMYDTGCKKIIAHRPLNNAAFLEGVDVLPPLEDDDVKEMSESEIDKLVSLRLESPQRKKYENIWIKGYNKCREKYRFTEEDVRKAIAMGYDWCHQKHIPADWMIDNFIKSLSQPMPVAFECEYNEINWGGVVEGRKKTFINPEGRTEWVGKYV